MDIFAFLVIGLASNSGTALTTIPEKYEYNQCQKIADEYKWPWKATCVRAQSVYKETGCVGTFYSKGYIELRPVECEPRTGNSKP